jgi:hypothetical protein
LSTATGLDFISRDCRNGSHQYCYGKWEGMGFEIICICNCGHKIKSDASTIFIEKSQHSESMVGPRDQSVRITTPPANWSDMNG